MGRRAFDEMAGMPNGHAPEAVRSAYATLKDPERDAIAHVGAHPVDGTP